MVGGPCVVQEVLLKPTLVSKPVHLWQEASKVAHSFPPLLLGAFLLASWWGPGLGATLLVVPWWGHGLVASWLGLVASRVELHQGLDALRGSVHLSLAEGAMGQCSLDLELGY